MKFQARQIKMNALNNKTVLITGATNGIGLVTTHELAKFGMEVYLICRHQSKGEQIIEEIKNITGNNKLHLLVCNLSSLEQVRKTAQAFLKLDKPLDLLVNNAGVINTNRKLTEDGYEEMFTVNHLAHFLLTNLLLKKLSHSARIVNVASGAHTLVKEINFEDLNFTKGFKTLKVYSHSKLANILFTRELAKRLDGTEITVNAVDPGEVSTGLGRQNKGVSGIIYWILKPFIQTPQKGASTSIYVSTSQTLKGVTGKYFRNCKEKEPKPWAKDDKAAKRLWNVSLKMVRLNS
ncbi:SDR family oxidoreductase [Aquimarina sp. M1]